MSDKIASLIIAFVYVALGTFYSFYAMNNMISSGHIYHILLPVSIIPQLILFFERDPFIYIAIIQIVTFGIVFLFIWKSFTVIRKFRFTGSKSKA